MNFIETFAAVQRRAVDLIEELAATNPRAADLAVSLGIPKATAGAYLRLAKNWNRKTLDIARDAALTLDACLAVEKASRKVPRDVRPDVRAELARLAAGHDVDKIRELVDTRVRAINAADDRTEGRAHTRRYVRGGVHTDGAGLRHATICLPERQMTQMMTKLDESIRVLRRADPRLTYEQAKVDALFNAVVSGRGGSTSPKEELVTCVVINLDTIDETERLELTDGSSMTPAQYAESKLAPYGLCLVYADNKPVDLFRTARFANAKQRQILAVDELGCAWPGCKRVAAACQPHHLHAWSKGGNTNLNKMALLCPKHNGMNDDDPAKPKNGHIFRDPTTGRIGWQPPNGGPPILTTRPGSGAAYCRGAG